MLLRRRLRCPWAWGSTPAAARARRSAPDDRILLYTDGITEARVQGTMFDLEANAPILADGTIDEALGGLVDRLQAFVGRRITDDVALMLLQQRGRAGAAELESPTDR